MATPLLSIVIPSKNRAVYALSAVKNILSIKDPLLEVLIHDNSDDDRLRQLLNEHISDSRLRYYFDTTEMPIVANFEKAMNLVRGEYVCFIGDDDGVNLELMEAVHWAKSNELDSIVGSQCVGYHWPKGSKKGNFTVYPFDGKLVYANPEEELQRFMKAGCVYYLNHKLPKAYHGIVKVSCLLELKKIQGEFFGGLAPDSFSSVSLSTIAKKVVWIDYPLIISGSSTASDQTHRTTDAKKMELRDAPHFLGKKDYPWPAIVPEVYAGETIWGASSVRALEATRREDLIKKIDTLKMGAIVCMATPHHLDHVSKIYLRKLNKDWSETKALRALKRQIFLINFENFRKKLLNRVKKILQNKKAVRFDDVPTLDKSGEVLKKYLKERNYTLSRFLN